MQLSVVISTYNAVAWLEKVLWGFAAQTFQDFELVIADDGSGPETRALLDAWQAEFPDRLLHVWHEDRGFQKSAILNRALVAARTPYVVFTDGDCIPRADFLAVHAAKRRQGRFLSGGYVKLPMSLSQAITRDDVVTGRAFRPSWLQAGGLTDPHALAKLAAGRHTARLLNRLTPTRPSWNGHNASGWRSDLLAANGFDERMQYGGQDRELGERLENAGVRGLQIRYSALCVHLDHGRGYKTPQSMAKNAAIRAATRQQGLTRTAFGIERAQHQPDADTH
jgi:glycosyltransferase involved in cell wall biosynthesis